MSTRRLSALVASLVLLTGLAVGFYVDALRSSPVLAAERAPIASALGVDHTGWSPAHNDVRTGGPTRTRANRSSKGSCSDAPPCPASKKRAEAAAECDSTAGVAEWFERLKDEQPVTAAGVERRAGA